MREILLTQGMVALVDDCDYAELARYKWFAVKGGDGLYYAGRQIPLGGSRRFTLRMHQAVLLPESGKVPDHINGNGLDNRRDNLRPASRTENMMNRRLNRTSKTGFKGVSFHQGFQKYRARINAEGRQYNLGWFDCPIKASLAYIEKAKELHKGFIRITA